MLISLCLTLVMAMAVATLVLITLGRRVRSSSVLLTAGIGLAVAVTAGELAAALFTLPSGQVLVAEVVLVVGVAAVTVVRPDWNGPGRVFFATVVLAGSSYLAVAMSVTVREGLPPVARVASGLVLGLESFALVLAATFAFEVCDVVCRVRWKRETVPSDPTLRPFVSLQVAAYNEPPEMLIETIQSLEALDYPHFEIVVIDNNTAEEEVWRPVEAYCAGRERVTFVHVDPWPGFKSGALNLALTRHTDPRAEVIGVVDADYLVRPDYLDRTVGLFADPRLAFVQTPQDYRDWEGDAYLTACHDAYRYFFEVAMRSRNERGSIIFGGTMGLIRRSALEEIGGWDEWCITEDAETSLRLLRAGWTGHYVHESFGQGIMPLTFSALKRQRFRWCFGGIQILRKHWRSLMPWDRDAENRLSRVQRLDYLIGGLQWFTDLLGLGFAIVLAASSALLLLGRPVAFRPLLGPIVLLPVVIAASGLVRSTWAMRVLGGISPRRSLLAFMTWLSLSYTVGLACGKGLLRRDGVFLRTPKWHPEGGLVEAFRAARAETTIAAALLVLAVTIALTRGRENTAVVGLAAAQGFVYASALVMAWLNLHTRLPVRLQRRQRTEERRERIQGLRVLLGEHAPRAGIALVTVAVVGVSLSLLGGGAGGKVEVPQRGADDRGPLASLGIIPDGLPAGNETPRPTAGEDSEAESGGSDVPAPVEEPTGDGAPDPRPAPRPGPTGPPPTTPARPTPAVPPQAPPIPGAAATTTSAATPPPAAPTAPPAAPPTTPPANAPAIPSAAQPVDPGPPDEPPAAEPAPAPPPPPPPPPAGPPDDAPAQGGPPADPGAQRPG